jgi:hypothetical protein
VTFDAGRDLDDGAVVSLVDSDVRAEDSLAHHDLADGLAQPLFERVGSVVTTALTSEQRTS